MIHFLYDAILHLAALFFIPYHIYRSRRRNRPAALAERLGRVPAATLAVLDGGRPIWVHAVSVGETIAVRPLLRALREHFPGSRIVLSSGTETGRSVALTYPEADLCLYFPFDLGCAVRRSLAAVRPAVILIVETEIWPNFLRTARNMAIPTVVVNGRISDRSFRRYLRLGWFFRPVLADISAFCMQSPEDGRRIAAIGAPAERVHITRNLKYDISAQPLSSEQRHDVRRGYRVAHGLFVFTAGSTHGGEEELVVRAYRQLLCQRPDSLLVLVPRHPERAGEVAVILKNAGLPFVLRSGLTGESESLAAGGVLLVDTVGELMRLYACSDIVFVGGSLVPTGGHNPLEPASLGLPVLFGPHMENFREIASLLLAAGAGVQVGSGEELATIVPALCADAAGRLAMGERGRRLVEENSGATERHIEVIARTLRAARERCAG
jgi:3-deoxy-D-manno-octulosonic-acid transferase